MRTDKWVRSTDQLPFLDDSPSGYFWCWDEKHPDDLPMLLEAWKQNDVPMGFCAEYCGIVPDISHWMPAIPPEIPAATEK